MEYAIVYYVTATVTPTERTRIMEPNIAVNLDTMAELAAEEARVRQEKTDWSNAAYREEAIRRVEERREIARLNEARERVRQQCIEEIGRACVKAANILTVAMVRNERHGSARLVELYQDVDNALTALGTFAFGSGKEN